jgi:ATP synthase I subunit
MAEADTFYAAAERRVEWLTAAIGLAGAAFALARWGWLTGGGVALGAALTWINFRWLKLGVTTLVNTSVAQSDQPRVRIPLLVYVKFFGRYALLLVVVYVILSRSVLPVAALVGGLFAAVAAVLVEVVWELVTGKLGAESHN